VLQAIPIASVTTTAIVNLLDLNNTRQAKIKSFQREFMPTSEEEHGVRRGNLGSRTASSKLLQINKLLYIEGCDALEDSPVTGQTVAKSNTTQTPRVSVEV
jgi:hypothetical protein